MSARKKTTSTAKPRARTKIAAPLAEAIDATAEQTAASASEPGKRRRGGARGNRRRKNAHQVHHADAGDVGETGAHGDLGTNAADHPARR